jgi:uncharacterized protein YyaL (SSP411 family)
MKKLAKKIVYYLYMICFISVFAFCKEGSKEDKGINQEKPFANELIHESSSYLLQHAHNPVNWYPWGEKALKKAKDENKLVIISIGYAACHWCHVMEKESFNDTSVANYMNEHFVCIKVDREERPDVDQVYMTASQLLTGSGGWPLNVLALSDGKPFFAGSYFSKNDWLKTLKHFVEIHKKTPDALIDQAQKVTQGVKDVENVLLTNDKPITTVNQLNNMFSKWKINLELAKGDQNIAPKFPMPSTWEYLLQYYYLTKNQEALKVVNTTLNSMAFGGIYDQLGGGFARYSTDANWIVPHFEKMLYDNAQLVSLYSHAYQLTKNPLYKTVVYQTLGFIEKELTSPEGGFYSSLDADSEGKEGEFYVWTYKEISDALGSDTVLFTDYYNITKQGNWERHKNILHREFSDEEIAFKHKISTKTLQNTIKVCANKLMQIRAKRAKPKLDDKILTGWNALMLKGYIDAYRVFGDRVFLEKALKNAVFLSKNNIAKSNEVMRNFKNNKAVINGLLDDYAFTISAFILLYQATFEEEWLYKAKDLTDYSIVHFFDKKSGMFFYTHHNYSSLIARKMEVIDNVIPSSNSEMAKNLLLLGMYFEDDKQIQMSKQMFFNMQKDVHNTFEYYSNWRSLEIQLLKQPYEIAIVGADFNIARREFDQSYLPNVIFLGGKTGGTLGLLKEKNAKGETTIFVCQNKVCKIPTTSVKDAVKQLK